MRLTASPIPESNHERARWEALRMTRNPNTNIADLHPADAARTASKADHRTLGSLLAAGFIIMVSFIVRHFYQ
ncbi:hypothetical protein K270103H11_18070 [Gordonibacter urolithinfaciens]